MSEDYELLLGGERIMRSCVGQWMVSSDRSRMVIFLRNPKRQLKITGAENVTQATLELNYDPTDPE